MLTLYQCHICKRVVAVYGDGTDQWCCGAIMDFVCPIITRRPKKEK